MKKLSVLLLTLLLVFACASCGVLELPANTDAAQAALNAAFSETKFEVTEDFTLDKTLVDEFGHEYEIVWTSSNEAVATVVDGADKVTVKVTPSYFENVVVKLTGTVTEGDVTASVTLTYTVPQNKVCVHDYKVIKTFAATCCDDGYEAYECNNCGRQYMITLFATENHNFEAVKTVAPTCTEKGYTVYECTVGGTQKADDYVDALGHTWELVEHVDAEAFTTHGYDLYACTVCEAEKLENVVHVYDYEYTDYTTPATCTEDGERAMFCFVCLSEGVQEYEWQTIPATGHTFIDGECHCGEEYVAEIPFVLTTELKTGDLVLIGNAKYGKLLSATKTGNYNVGVNYSTDDFTKVTDAEIFVVTVNEDGTYSFVSLTGKALAMGADYASLNDAGANTTWTLTTNEDGTFLVRNVGRQNYLEWYNKYTNWSTYNASYAATDDQFHITFYVKVDIEHVHNHISKVTAPTCTEAGYTTYTCACGDTYTEEGEAATGEHKYDAKVTAPTCIAAGYTTYTCVCGDTYTEAGEAATGEHVWGTDGKCTTEGCTAEKPADAPAEPVLAGKADFETIANGYGQYNKTFETTAGWTTVYTAIQTHAATSDANPAFVTIPEGAKAVCLNGRTTQVGKVTSPTLTGGIKKITFTWAHLFSDQYIDFTIIVTDLTTGAKQTMTFGETFASAKDQQFVHFTEEWTLDTAITGDFTIEIINNCPSQNGGSNKDRVSIWDLAWYN